VATGVRLEGITVRDRVVHVNTSQGDVTAKFMVNCGGLWSDRIASMAGASSPARIVPFRGEYFDLAPGARHLVRGLVYPVPDPAFPFLGVHLTRMISGAVHAGPNAVLSLARGGYSKTAFNLRDVRSALTFAGFWRLVGKHWKAGMQEAWRSASKAAFTRSVQRLLPAVTAADLVPSTPGIRAQAMLPDGRLVDDFLIVDGPQSLHVCNAPSPGATASLEIGRFVCEQVVERMAL
jgi:L-2-hydroxyglutarate oxidase